MDDTALELPDIAVEDYIGARKQFGNVRLRPYTFWLPDPDDPVFIERMRKSSEAIAHAMKHSKEEQQVMRECEAAAAELLKDEPPYDWGDDEP